MATNWSIPARPVLLPFIVFYFLYLPLVVALQVTPNSPCSQFCIDDTDLDRSDPNSSNTSGDDIVCKDADFTKNAKGQKFQRCLACLQDSNFERGEENDQDWFLYNLQYSLSYCVFGYPNATGIGSSPCVTSEACGALESALKTGITDPDDRSQYGYCKADENAMLGDAYEKCHACLKADRTQFFVSNFLVALEAGCQQQPPVGTLVGLNDTVFSDTTIEIVDPNPSDDEQPTATLSNAAIAGIVIGAIVFLIAAASCTYMQWRKRRNRLERNRYRASSLSFRCQAHLTPREPGFRNVTDEDLGPPRDEKGGAQETVSLELGPFAIDSKSPWNPRNAPKLSFLTTSLPSPPLAHTDLKSSATEDVSPASTVSVRSNAPLLFSSHNSSGQPPTPPPPGIVSPLFSPGFTVTTPRTPRVGFPRDIGDSNNPWGQSVSGSSRDLMKKNSWGSVAPVEIRNVQIKFDPPPKKVKKGK